MIVYEFKRPDGMPVYRQSYTQRLNPKRLDLARQWAEERWGTGSTLVEVKDGKK